jgi:hypothetical protein
VAVISTGHYFVRINPQPTFFGRSSGHILEICPNMPVSLFSDRFKPAHGSVVATHGNCNFVWKPENGRFLVNNLLNALITEHTNGEGSLYSAIQ